eukprot:CAMPEP_0174733504 /NCGR_PEP_ID=MMETSP1094-20130205/61443_1 /TAXON_ID=156173 /ORGANISM="Chrysochromulina brevifilum, Strain UTEX LB 985" /LENGTH=99 /DNA_ID=CAMNT_0015936167 /DNA_START=83 /DNA_END=382 /DNA_ORIENTATION=+
MSSTLCSKDEPELPQLSFALRLLVRPCWRAWRGAVDTSQHPTKLGKGAARHARVHSGGEDEEDEDGDHQGRGENAESELHGRAVRAVGKHLQRDGEAIA